MSILPKEIRKALQSILADKVIAESAVIGDSSAHVMQWPQRSIVGLFDGRNHLGINLFTYDEDKDFRDELLV